MATENRRCFASLKSASEIGMETVIVTVCVNTTEVVPLLSKLQPSSDALPARLVFPCGQSAHAKLPVDWVNLPGTHALHKVAPRAERNVPGSHLMQVEDPSIGENVPAMHSAHAAADLDPSVCANFPATHACLSVDDPVQ